MVRVCLVCLVLISAACGGGGGGGGSGIDPRVARLDGYAAMQLRILGDPAIGRPAMPETDAAHVPAAGTATYTGGASILVALPDSSLSLFGDANLTVDFAVRTVDGEVLRVFGQTPGGNVADYQGFLVLDGLLDDGAMTLAYAGRLSAGGTGLDFDGVIAAHLLGASATAFAGGDLDARILQNGTPRDGAITIFGEGRVEPPAAP